MAYYFQLIRAVAQSGSALPWGGRGPGFKSRRPDNFPNESLGVPRRSSRLAKRDESRLALLRSADAELRRAGEKRVELLSRPEINLPLLEIDFQDSDAQVGAGLVDFS